MHLEDLGYFLREVQIIYNIKYIILVPYFKYMSILD